MPWHIELIQMDIHDYQSLLKTQLITSIQVHLYDGPEMIFHNTVLYQTAKLLPPNLTPTFVPHPHPQNALAPPPFSILNHKHIKSRQDTYKLVLTLLQLAQQSQEERRDARDQQQITISLSAVLKQCEQLSDVATFLNEDDLNPFWVLLNPILKLRQHLRLTRHKQSIVSNSQYFMNGDQVNSDYFLYRLNLLEDYIKQVQRQGIHRLSNRFIKICLIALLKHIQNNYSQLMEVVLKQPLLKQINENKIAILVELGEIYRRAVEANKAAIGAYVNFQLPGQTQPQLKPEEEQYQTMKEKWIRALVKPVSVTAIMVLLMIFKR